MDNLGPLGLACGEGLFPGADCSPTTGQPTQSNKVERGAEQADIREGPRTGAEGSSQGSEPAARPVYQSYLPGPQEGRVTQTRGKLETTEPFCGKVQVQDGGGKDAERPDQEERLDDLHRSQGGLPIGADRGERQEVPQVCVGRQDVRVSVSPLRALQCTANLHQTIEAGDGPSQEERSAEHDFPGRHAAAGRIEAESGTVVTGSPESPQTAWVPVVSVEN